MKFRNLILSSLPFFSTLQSFLLAPTQPKLAKYRAVKSDLPDLSQAEVRRYSRHLILPNFGLEGQRKLKASKVAVVGAGGLGSPALLYLAAAGVGTLGIIDHDVVDESNLQRQVIHGTSTLSEDKVDSALARISDINPHVNVNTYAQKLSSDNAMSILENYDVVLDGSDNFPTKYLLNDACAMLGIPVVYGAILGFEGQVSVFSYKGGPNYRDLLPSPPNPGDVPSCAEGGVLGVLPGVIGCLQATEVIKVLAGVGNILSGRLVVYDALAMSFREKKIVSKNEPITELIDYQGFCGYSTNDQSGFSKGKTESDRIKQIGALEAKRRLEGGWTPFVLDVRLPEEVAICTLPFADLNCPHTELEKVIDKIPKERDILVYCKLGGRSKKACHSLADLGCSRIYDLQGGIVAWAKEIDRSLALY
mmetsp:Transcript_3369/g.5253  ORF Transcript_3369/g.5253 Transcript_3369/m.5253 type:complete len:420 (+) Transcript_3369:75-1334(+)